ncbi:redoxin domain-containing protein [Luteolibacter sp. GHJ8]|uniref:Redoxin domain-containing protein n=1 Tax=Luteolibacter rhizosphaerae TaxID=2989719 RepID=A0ABT3G1Q4_9BACT|nr:redoxin family protein [Luteolibacter rhizosphaerae]MCW1913592.1 redoxin domain-containing protein [Luteolibacter rhizosphaerae]
MKQNTFLGAVIGAMICSATAWAAEPGDAAPAFTVKNVKGEEVTLAKQKGKVVVLEWVNYECPFVKKHYGSGNLPKLQEKYTGKDVVWITVASGAEGEQGYLPAGELAARSEKEGNKASEIVLDTDGKVGKAYGAKTTPQLIVIDKEGKVAYNGAIDSKATTEAADIASADSYISAALDSVLAGKTVDKAKTQPYGCGVKYAK